MIPFLLAAVPFAPLPSAVPQPSSRSGTLIAAQPSSSQAVCPAPAQATALASSRTTPVRAGNNFNLAAVTALFPSSLANRPSALSLSVPLTTSRYPGNGSDNNNSNSDTSTLPCSLRTALQAAVTPVPASNLAANPRQAALGFAFAGSSSADGLYDPSRSSDAELTDLLGNNSDYSLTAYQKKTGFDRRLQGWLSFTTASGGLRELRGKAVADSYRIGSITLTFNNSSGAAGSKGEGVNYPVLHVANLGGGTLQTSDGGTAGLSTQLLLTAINGEAAPANAVVLLSGRNLTVNGNLLSNSASNTATNKAFGSATIKGEDIRSLTFDVFVQGSGSSGTTYADSGAGQDPFFLSLTSATEAPLAYGYGSLQAGVGFPGAYGGPIEPMNSQLIPTRNNLGLNTGFNGELAAGYRGRTVRSDLSVGYSNFGNQLQTITIADVPVTTPGIGSVSLFTVMANGYLDFKVRNQDGTISRWSPYLGAGIGLGSINSPGCSQGACFEAGSGSGFAYQLKAGISYRANDTARLFLEGGYLGITGTRIGSVNYVDYDSFGTWRVNLGWRQAF